MVSIRPKEKILMGCPMAKSNIEKMVEAVNWFEDSLNALNEEARNESSKLIGLSDELGRSIMKEKETLLKSATKELEKSYKEVLKGLREKYKKKEEEELLQIEALGKENHTKAVEQVTDKIKELLQR
ncbi:MAG: hypothetical protein G5Z43_000485 [Caldisphaeraceae archaeon]|nr:hypothetical protein [Caldisphaeraceae archaeon]